MPAAGPVAHGVHGGVPGRLAADWAPGTKIADLQEVVTVLRLLPAQLPWWLAGLGMGLCVVALYGLANRRLGRRRLAGSSGRPDRALAR